jgi:hypothetical protein
MVKFCGGQSTLRAVLIVVTVALLLSPSVAESGFFGGQKLKQRLDATERVERGTTRGVGDFSDASYGIGYVIGVADAYDDVHFCLPTEVAVGQVVAMVRKYLAENPDKWNQPGELIVLFALRPHFPCKRKTSP